MSINLIVADDHAVVRLGIRYVLSGDPRFKIIGEAGCVSELLDVLRVQGRRVDLLVTDFEMPDATAPDGNSMLKIVRRAFPRLPIVVLTVLENETALRVMLKSGVRGIVSKSDSLCCVPEALAHVWAGLQWVSTSYADTLARNSRRLRKPEQVLSCKEIEVLRLYASGLCVAEIADLLARTPSTVSRHRMSGMQKLGIASDLELYSYADRSGLVQATRRTLSPSPSTPSLD